MKNLDLISEELFNKIRGRFPSVTIGDVEGKVTNKPALARFFDFDYKEGDANLGKVSVTVTEEAIEVMYSDNFVAEQDEITKQKWYDFLKEMRQFAKKRLMKFDTRNINKSNLDRRDYEFLAANRGDNQMSESKLYGTNKISYQKIGEARIMIKHTESVNPELGVQRTRNIGRIYIESADGERFLYPYKHLTGARAMARHVAEGGKPHDDFGTHIVGLSEEMNKLRKFKSYMGRSAVMAESLAGYMDVVKERIATVRKTIESLQKPNYYKTAFESFEKPMMEEVPSDVAENWIDQLTIKQFNEELKDVFPYIYNLVSEATKAKGLSAVDLLHPLGEDAPVSDIEIGAPAESYKVQSGDTLYSIAKKFQHANFHGADIDEAVKEIMMLNDISDPKALQVGMTIEMPYFMGSGPDGSTRGLPGSFDKYEEQLEDSFEEMMGQFAEDTLDEGYMKGYSKYHCEDCGCQMHNCKPDCDCSHDSHDETGSWWKDANGNGVPDGLEKTMSEAQEMCPKACCGKPVTECACGPDCKHCDCYEKNKTNEGNKFSKKLKIARDKDDDEMELDGKKIPVTEFVLSLFNREDGTFPKGETAVLTAIEKDYGEQYIEPAKQFIERIQATFEQYKQPVQEPMIDEEPIEQQGTVMEPTVAQDEAVGESGKNKTTKEAKDIMRLAGL